MIGGLTEKSVAELISLKSNYEKRLNDSAHGMSLNTAKSISQQTRAIRDELKRRKQVMSCG